MRLRTTGGVIPDAKAAVPALLSAVKSATEPGGVRAASADALGGIGAEPGAVAPALKGAIEDRDVRLRLACASALYKFDKGNAKLSLPVLRAGLRDKGAQMDAVLRLKALGSDAKGAIPDLISLVVEGGEGGYYAPEALGAIPEAEAALLTALKSPDAATRRAAATALPKAFPEAARKAELVK
jgi:HEAT repeat protein